MRTNVKHSGVLRRAIATLLCMLFMLMPVTPASAKSVEVSGGGTTVLPDDFSSGLIFLYEPMTVGTKKIGKVTFGIYGMDTYIMSLAARVKYSAAVTPVTAAGEEPSSARTAIVSATIGSDVSSTYNAEGEDYFGVASLSKRDWDTEARTYGIELGTFPVSDFNDGSGDGIKFPPTKFVPLATMHFADAYGGDIPDSVGQFLSVNSDDEIYPSGGYIEAITVGEIYEDSPRFYGFPETTTEEQTKQKYNFTVNDPSKVPLANVAITFTNKDGSEEPFTIKPTSIDGTYDDVELIEGATYTITAVYEGTDTKYENLADYTEEFTVPTTDGDTTIDKTINMVYEGTQLYSLKVKVVDGDNYDNPIASATVSYGGRPIVTDEYGVASFENLTSDTVELFVTASGYENYAQGDGVKILRTADGVTITGIDASLYRYVETDETLILVMSREKLGITLPVPVPEGFTTTDAENMKVIISANPAGSTPATLSLPITLTTTESEGNWLEVTSTGDAVDSINAKVNLPAGNYNVTIVAPGVEDKKTTLNIVTNTTTTTSSTTVNVGGEVQENGTITGGYTDTTPGSEIDLSDTNISPTVGSTINTDGTVSEGTAAEEGGVLANGDSSGLDDIVLITDPLYYAIGTFNEGKTEMTVKVYLKNVAASNGTFALKFDNSIFKLSNTDGFVPAVDLPEDENGSSDITFAKPTNNNSDALTVPNPKVGDDYHAFYWELKGEYTTTDATLIATYKLAVDSSITASTIENYMHNEAIYIKPYKDIEVEYGGETVTFAEAIDTYYAGYEALAVEQKNKYWRDIIEQPTGTLNNDLALEDGFFRVYGEEPGVEGKVVNLDVRSQFIFDDYGNVAVTLKAVDTDNKPIENVRVNVYLDGTGDPTADEVKFAYTNKDGVATFAWPENYPLEFQLTHSEYLPSPSDGISTHKGTTKAEATYLGQFMLASNDGHPVKLAETTDAKANLLGGVYAYKGVDYFFSLEPEAGYSWVGGTMPAPGDLTIKIDVNADGNYDENTTLSATWDAASNRYKIAGDTIPDATANSDGKLGAIEISFDLGTYVKETPGETYTITATAGTGGKVSYVDAGLGSAIVGTSGATGTVTETLAEGVTESAEYTFTPDTSIDPKMIIDKILINGVSITPTAAERVNGYTHKFTAITGNQTIVVTFGTGDPEKPEEIDPADDDKAILSVTLGDYGSATITGAATGSLTGSASGSYLVTLGGDNVVINVTADQAVPVPGSEDTQDYVVDKIYINGVAISAGDTRWVGNAAGEGGEDTAGTLTLISADEFAAGEITEVVITFRTEREPGAEGPTESFEAIVQTSVVSGKGEIIAFGTTTYNVGDTPTFTIKPDETWTTSKLMLTEPGKNGEDVIGQITDGTYKVPALNAGITKIEVSFEEVKYNLIMKVNLLSGYSPGSFPVDKTNAVVTFESTEGGYTRTESFSAKPISGIANFGAGTTSSIKIPQGTWKVTISKQGYLDYIIDGFTVNEGGTVAGTFDKDGYIYFGRPEDDETTEAKEVNLTIGDADRDRTIISLDDVAQVINGMITNAGDTRIERADFTEDGTTNDDMAYVKQFYGLWYTTTDYTSFLGSSAS